jgi:hypothetical protein
MNPSREEALLVLALEKPADKRSAFLDAMREGDPSMRARLEALIAAHEQSDDALAAAAPSLRSASTGFKRTATNFPPRRLIAFRPASAG